MKREVAAYSCDNCHRKLPRNSNLDIVTSISEGGVWSRLHVQIMRKHGIQNKFEIDQADLCRPCTIDLLSDALKRVRKGERATAGTESGDQVGWN